MKNYFKKHCSVCPTEIHCCKFKDNKGFTFVSIKNAKEIKKHTKKDYSYFLDYSPLPKKTISFLKKGDPALEGFLRYNMLDSNYRLLRLKIKENGNCIFLNNDNKCEIYAFRPSVCKIYPFYGIRLLNNKVKIIPHDSDPKCSVITELNSEDVEEILLEKENKSIKNEFIKIEQESIEYKKNILKISIEINK